jgi:hypothetical protein
VNHCFFSIRTQFDNLGDALINRELLRLCAGFARVELDLSRCPPGFRREVLGEESLSFGRSACGAPTGEGRCPSRSPGYLETRERGGGALGLHGGILRLMGAMLRVRLRGRRAVWFLSPGGYVGEIGWGELARRLPNLLLLALFRLIGVRICLVGVSYERLGPRHLWLLRLRGRLLHVHCPRDRRSLDYARAQGLRPQRILPDLAMNLFGPPPRPGPAERVALAFRTDQRQTQAEVVAALARWLARGLPGETEFLLVAQVARDLPGMRRLQEVLRAEGRGAELVACETLEQCEAAYDRCGLVIGNRLHALLIGGSRGCRMLACVEGTSNAKLRGLFEALGLQAQLLDMGAPREEAARVLARTRQAPPFDGRPWRGRLQAGLCEILEERDEAVEPLSRLHRL